MWTRPKCWPSSIFVSLLRIFMAHRRIGEQHFVFTHVSDQVFPVHDDGVRCIGRQMYSESQHLLCRCRPPAFRQYLVHEPHRRQSTICITVLDLHPLPTCPNSVQRNSISGALRTFAIFATTLSGRFTQSMSLSGTQPQSRLRGNTC